MEKVRKGEGGGCQNDMKQPHCKLGDWLLWLIRVVWPAHLNFWKRRGKGCVYWSFPVSGYNMTAYPGL